VKRLLFLALLSLSIISCGEINSDVHLLQSFPYTVADSTGNDIEFTQAPERIVVYDAGAVETLFAIGEGHRIVATHSFVTYPPEVDQITKVGDAFNLNIEQVIELKPDLVYVFSETFIPQLTHAGLKVLYIKTVDHNFRSTTDMIEMWGQITGNIESANQLVRSFNKKISTIESKLEVIDSKSQLSILQDVGQFWVPGANTLMGEVFDLIAVRNIAADISGYGQISPELIISRNPDIVITVDPNMWLSDNRFANISAVKKGKVYQSPSDKLSVAGPRFADGIEELAILIYPELFNK
tara:strand:- start:584 stop:1471 length:888 start_codon:yes stop_codon:yes gene_type:complete